MSVISFTGFGYAKALIFGEYAVMHGAPALTMALSKKLHLTLTPTSSPLTPQSNAFIQKLSELCQSECHCQADIQIDSDAFCDEHHQKYGIGSSAAAVVALMDALHQFHKTPNIDLKKAILLHRKLQNNMGSGCDVIASLLGGIHLVEHCPTAPFIQPLSSQQLPCIAILATHRQAPTTHYLEAAKQNAHTSKYRILMDALTECYNNLANDLIQGKKSVFLEQMATLPALLKSLGDLIGKEIVPPGFDMLFSIAQNCHVTLKPSGAGGGDIYLAMSESSESLNTFLRHLPDGMTPLPYQIAPLRQESLHG